MKGGLVHIKLKPEVLLELVYSARTVPIPLQPMFKSRIEIMEAAGIIQ
jgi:hypothetical protein